MRNTHGNSRAAYRAPAVRRVMKGRQAQIIDCIREHGPMTDRQIQERLGLRDMNQVRPRVTELREMRVLREVGSARCPVTGRRVRVCGLGEPGVLFDGVA